MKVQPTGNNGAIQIHLMVQKYYAISVSCSFLSVIIVHFLLSELLQPSKKLSEFIEPCNKRLEFWEPLCRESGSNPKHIPVRPISSPGKQDGLGKMYSDGTLAYV